MLRERAAHLDTTGLVPLFLNLVPLLEHWSKRGARGGERSGGGGGGSGGVKRTIQDLQGGRRRRGCSELFLDSLRRRLHTTTCCPSLRSTAPSLRSTAPSGCRGELDATNEGGVVGLGLLHDVLRHPELLHQLFFAGFVTVERWEHLFAMLQIFSAGEG